MSNFQVPSTAKPIINLPHHRKHEGVFLYSTVVFTNFSIPKYILLSAPPIATIPLNTNFIHLIFTVESDLGVDIEFFEDPTFSDKGVVEFRFLSNRNKIFPIGPGEWSDTLVTNEGFKIYEERLGSNVTGGIGGPMYRNEDETILKLGSYYLIKITPLANDVSTTIKIASYSNRATPT
jgi:hypothetical protein